MKNLTKKILAATMAATMIIGSSMTALAGQWQQNGAAWKYQNDNGAYAKSGWSRIDGKCYYFDGNGIMLVNTTTPDGFTVDSSGALVVSGVVQTQAEVPAATGVTNNEIAAAVQRAKAAGAGSYQDQYISGGWRNDSTESDLYSVVIRASKDSDGMLISPTSGIVAKAQRGSWSKDYMAAGSDRSIRLATDPSGGNLQPNWIYNPLGKQIVAPPVISMDKNSYDGIGWLLTTDDTNTGDTVHRMDTCDTSGSWVYNPNPTGTADYYGQGGQLSGWMYRYADGSYAANGMAYIYDGSASDTADHKGPYVSNSVFYFNENGFMIINSSRADTFINELGQVCDGTAGAYGVQWHYTK